jgi:hypothetical protein
VGSNVCLPTLYFYLFCLYLVETSSGYVMHWRGARASGRYSPTSHNKRRVNIFPALLLYMFIAYPTSLPVVFLSYYNCHGVLAYTLPSSSCSCFSSTALFHCSRYIAHDCFISSSPSLPPYLPTYLSACFVDSYDPWRLYLISSFHTSPAF